MCMLNSLRLGVAGALVMIMPLQAVGATVRSSASIPAAASAVAADDRCDRDGDGRRDDRCGTGVTWAWPAIGVIVAAIVLAVVLSRHNDRGRGTGFSR